MSTQDFRRLWYADAFSQLGTRISAIAIPLLAATTLHASTWHVALLTTAETLPFLLLGLLVGAWADRMRRRPVLVAADLGRAAALGSVPAVAAFGPLTLGQLYAVAFATGVLTVFFDVSHRAYLPQVVGREHLVKANSRLEANRTVGYSVGPTAGGYLVQWLGAPLAVLLDAVSFLWSAGWIASIRTPESRPRPAAAPDLRREVVEGLRFVLGDPLVRATTLFAAAANLLIAMTSAVEVLFLLRTVGLPPGLIGLLMGGCSLGAVAGAIVAAPAGRRLGDRRALTASALGMGLSSLLVPLAGPGPRLALFAVGAGATAFCISVHAVVSMSLRQRVCPDHLLGRMTAIGGFLVAGTLPLGGLLAGALGSVVGLRATLWTAAAGLLAAALCLALSRALRPRLPQPAAVGRAGREGRCETSFASRTPS
ncbi:MAG: MFS transporter [Micromonosporaceae bacterium]|nr:MFS transporter [Micromonosporaceae bacterium]